MTLTKNLICMIKGSESVLFVLPNEVATELEFTDDDLIKFEVKNGSIIIQKEIAKFNDSLEGTNQT
jgi:antitoxin component of MazEF toxin-antitoxin module